MNMRPNKSTRGLFSRIVASAAVASVIFFCTGCPPRGEEGIVPFGSKGEPRELNEIVRVIRENGDRLDRAVWADSTSVHAAFTDDRRKARRYNLEGTLLYQSPRDLRIDLRPTLGEKVMGIGSNQSEYWMWVEPDVRAMHWGRHMYAGSPCAGPMPVRPDQLAAALRPTLPNDASLQGPVLKPGKSYDKLQYMRGGAASSVDREYWVERRAPFMIRQVVFRNETGRIVVSVKLDNYRPAWKDGPLMPHLINVLELKGDSSFTLRADAYRGVTSDKVKAGSFDRPTRESLPSGVERIIQIDADCDGSASLSNSSGH